MTLKYWLLVVGAFAPWFLGDASAAERADHHRMQYPADEEVPDGFALRLLGDAAVQDFEMATNLMASYTRLDDEAISALLLYLQRLNRAHVAERRKTESEVACNPAPETDEKAIELMTLLDDVRFAIDEKYYLIAKGNLSVQQSEALDSALKPLKRGTSITLLDHKAVYATAPMGAAVNDLAQFCAKRGGNHRHSSNECYGSTGCAAGDDLSACRQLL